MTQVAVKFDHLTKYYPSYKNLSYGIKHVLFNLPTLVRSMWQPTRFLALSDLTFEVYKGETFGIIGRNGAGKSTLLGLIAGVLKPTSGSITVNGRVSPLLELGAGFHPELNGYENILLNGIIMGLTKREVMERIDAIIEFSELADFIHQPIRTYSSGMLAKLGFSVVTSLHPEIILLDEVLAVGDIVFARKCEQRMQQFWDSPDITTIFVSHDMESVKKICQRVAWIENHQLKQIGPAEEVVEAYKEFWLGPQNT